MSETKRDLNVDLAICNAEVERLRSFNQRMVARIRELEARLARIEGKRAKAREQFEALRKKLRKCCVCGRPFVASDPEEVACSPWCGENLTEEATADDQAE
jgi:chromosome segregation ATPase